jgi:hypothetical protein
MIFKRRVARARRVELQRTLFSHLEDLQAEANFESSLAAAVTEDDRRPIERCFSEPHFDAWHAPIASRLEQLHAAFQRDTLRATRPPPPELLRQLKAARREKVENKTRERVRQARGEVLMATRRRARLGFPAHVLARWTPEARRANLLARRSVGEVGYVGQVKRALGYGVPLEGDDPVDEATRERLDRLAEEVRRSNQRRRDTKERIAS